MIANKRSLATLFLLAALTAAWSRALSAQVSASQGALPALHHVGLNSLDPDRAMEWYLRVWPAARRTAVAGQPGVQAEMLLLFNRVASAPAGAWRDELHRADPQSPFWHIGAFTNTTNLAERLKAVGVTNLPLFISPEDRQGVWRSGLVPYAGTHTRSALDTVPRPGPREGGFSYVVAPDGVLFEFTGGPQTTDALAHIHFYHEQPLCAANWYVTHLGMELPPVRDGSGPERPRPPWDPCVVPHAEATWPSLEPIGTIRGPSGSVRFAGATMSWYPRQCVGQRCGRDQPLVSSRGQALDHIAFAIQDLEARVAALRAAGVKILLEPYPFEQGRAVMIEDPDGLAIELIETTRR